MKEEQRIENQKIRVIWDEQAEKWWFSVLDVIGILTEANTEQLFRLMSGKKLINPLNEKSVLSY